MVDAEAQIAFAEKQDRGVGCSGLLAGGVPWRIGSARPRWVRALRSSRARARVGHAGPAWSDGWGVEVARLLGPGPASLEGLRWLARVGPSPIEACGCAMGWSGATARSHAARLVREGWVARRVMTRGEGSLLVATRAGVRVAGAGVSAAVLPEPTWWAHLRACAWVAAWLTVRGRSMLGGRELLVDGGWRGELVWSERGVLRQSGHTPDLAGGTPGAGWVAIEVELAHKSTARLRAIVGLHAGWIAAGRTVGVMYVCGDRRLAERVRALGGEVGLRSESRTLRTELLAEMRGQALAARDAPTGA
jgi:hypothetical protein